MLSLYYPAIFMMYLGTTIVYPGLCYCKFDGIAVYLLPPPPPSPSLFYQTFVSSGYISILVLIWLYLLAVMQFGGQHPGGIGVPAVGMAFPGYVAQPQLGLGNSEMTWYPFVLNLLFLL